MQPTTEGAPVFRATLVSPLNVDTMRDLLVGEVVPVLCNPGKQDVKFDTSDPAIRRDTQDNAKQAAFDALRNAAPGSSPAAAGIRPSSSFSDQARAVAQTREMLAARIAEIQQAKQSDDRAEDGALTAQSAEPALPHTPTPPADPLERLQKLADLHDRGALSDAEFAAEKAKILGG